MNGVVGTLAMKRSIVNFLVGCLCFFSLGSVAVGEPEGGLHVMEEVVVTSAHKNKLIDTPASISIITAQDLSEIGAKNIIEALERIPGVYNTSASRTSLSIRGTRSSMAGGPVIMVDGVVQKYGSNRYEELDVIPVSQIERIEVLRSAGIAGGPGSGRGVINVITKKGRTDKSFTADISSSYGSWDTFNVGLGIGGAIHKWDYFGNFTSYGTSGYEGEEQQRNSFLMRLGFNPTANTRIGIRGSRFINEKDSASMKDQWELDNYRKALHFPDGQGGTDLVWHATREQDASTYAAEFSHQNDQSMLDASLGYTRFEETYHDTKDIFTSTRTSRGDIDASDQDSYFVMIKGGYRFDVGNGIYTPAIGARFDTVEFSNRRTYPFDTAGTRSTARYDIDLEETEFGVFWDNDILFNDNWALKAGTRIDWVDLEYADQDGLSFDSSDALWGWSVAPSYRYSSRANIYLSVGRNYWFPSPKYYQWAVTYDAVGNRPEDLTAEETTTYEIGYKHLYHKAFNINVAMYRMDQKDKFAGYYEGGSFRGMKNSGESLTYGIELEADGRLLEWFGYRLAGTYIDAQWKSGTQRVREHPTNTEVVVELDGQHVLGIPQYAFQVGLDFFPASGLKLSVDVHYYGDYYIDYLNRLEYPSKTTVDAAIIYNWKRYRFWVIGKNILDEEIETPRNTDGELSGVNGVPITEYYVQDGAYVEVGMSFSF